MASRIDPDPKPKPAASHKPAAAKPAAPGAAAAKPAAPHKPSGPPPAAGKPGVAAAQRSAADADEGDDADEAPAISAGFLKQMPAWAISMLVHIVALLAMALIVTPAPEKEKIRVITSSAPEVEENFEEFEEEKPLENTEETEVTEMVVPTDVTVVEDVKVIANADDVDAAPLAVELTDFGSETAPAADMMATIGAVGGTAGGLGGRANAKALAAAGGGGGDTEAAVDRALKWFIEHQLDDGSWSMDFNECPRCRGKCGHSGDTSRKEDRAGATALALLPFLGRGYTHKEGPYKRQIERGVAYLAARAVEQKGKVYGKGGSLYSQGLAGIALSECYGMTQDNRLAQPTQLALNFIMTAQDQRGGGWRYQPGQAGDTSAVGWQIMALKSGNMAYLQVNPLTIKKAVEFLNFVQADSGATYGYTDNSTPAPARSAVGLLCRMYLGWKKDNPALQDGVARLAKVGPAKDLYFDYYATQIMHHMEGDMWVAWNTKMKKMLLESQSKKDHEAGSWYEGFDSGHAAHAGGRLYCTAMATMILEVYYRHLPIYRNESVDEEFKE